MVLSYYCSEITFVAPLARSKFARRIEHRNSFPTVYLSDGCNYCLPYVRNRNCARPIKLSVPRLLALPLHEARI